MPVHADGALTCVGQNKHGRCDVPADVGSVGTASELADRQAVVYSSEYPMTSAWPFAENIVHVEPPLSISPEEASLVASEIQAGMVERLVCSSPLSAGRVCEEATALEREDIFLLEFNRMPRKVVEILSNGPQLKSCRDNLVMFDFSWKLVSGAMVFVLPEHYVEVMRALIGHELKSSHVIVTACLENAVAEAIEDIGSGAWTKQRTLLKSVLDVDEKSVAASTSSRQQQSPLRSISREVFETLDHWSSRVDISIERTFLCAVAFDLEQQHVVASSTTAARSRVKSNPRGIAL